MQTLKPPRRDVTNTQWQTFTGQFNKLVSDQAAFRTSVSAALSRIEASQQRTEAALARIEQNTAPANPPTSA